MAFDDARQPARTLPRAGLGGQGSDPGLASKIPSTYKHAGKLGPDGRAALAGARLVWDGLPSDKTREALRDGWSKSGKRNYHAHVSAGTLSALIARGVVSLIHDDHGWAHLTPLGILVREAGTRSQVEVSDG